MSKVVVKTVPKTTNNITRAIVNFLIIRGHSAARINTQGQAYEKTTVDYFDNINTEMAHRPSGARVGVSDIIAALRLRSGRPAVFIAIEVKRKYKKGGDRVRKEQAEYLAEIEATGGLTFIAEDAEKFIEHYNNFLLPEIINKA